MATPTYHQLGNNATTNNNITLRANDDGTLSICKGTAASPTELVKLDASGNILFGLAAVGLYFGSGAPSSSAGKGSLYVNTTATTTTTRLYINTDGATTWANFTASA